MTTVDARWRRTSCEGRVWQVLVAGARAGVENEGQARSEDLLDGGHLDTHFLSRGPGPLRGRGVHGDPRLSQAV